MTRNLLLGTVIAIATAVACGKPDAAVREPVAANPSDEQDVLTADDAYAAAEVRRDEPVFRKSVDDRFVQNHADGTTSGKDAFINAVLRLKLVDQTISERSVVVEGSMAIVFATTTLRFDQSEGPIPVSTLRYSALYVKRGAEWRMLGLHIQPRVR